VSGWSSAAEIFWCILRIMGRTTLLEEFSSMLRKPTFWILNAVVAVLLLAGCRTSGNGPSPSPTPAPQQAATRYVEGRTEIIDPKGNTQPSTDDGDHCYHRENQGDSPRNLVLTVHAPEISDANTNVVLADFYHGTQRKIPDIKVDSVNHIATVTIQDPTSISNFGKKTSSSNGDNRQHLGPGPYDASISIDMTVGQKDKNHQPQPIILPFSYVTYPDDKTECPVLSLTQASR
jgi:hypothetical protein